MVALKEMKQRIVVWALNVQLMLRPNIFVELSVEELETYSGAGSDK